MAVGCNYKDYLINAGLVPTELRNSKGKANNPEFGFECSGIVTRVGSNIADEFKVGDQVFSMTSSSTSSHVYSHKDKACLKPDNISFVEAASMVVYATVIHSFYNIDNLQDSDESILIHGGTCGVGLAALNVLKLKGHKGLIFVTVGSDEKKQYLLDNYGELITGGIYSTRNTFYVDEIKDRLKSIGSTNDGVDLILNTLN